MAEPQAPLPARVASAASRAAGLRARAETTQATLQAPPALPATTRTRMYAAAELFFGQRHKGSWVPAYLEQRGLHIALQQQWSTGYAPRGWTNLTSHLRGQGYSDTEIEASGLAFRAKRGQGNLVDLFRDRAIWPVRAEDGTTVAFIGRAAPGSDDEKSAKYLNSPDSDGYHKAHILFGLAEGRRLLAAGARPVIVEGVPDAIAVNAAGRGRYAAVAACGTALTPHHAAALARHADLAQVGVLVAMDGDPAGHRGMIAAYHALTALTDQTHAVVFPDGRDPAELLRTVGPAALVQGMEQRTHPLADLVIDAHIEQLSARYEGVRSYDGGPWLQDIGGTYFVVYDVAKVITQMPPAHIARQAGRVAHRFGLDYPQVTAALISAITDVEDAPKRLARWSRTDGPARGPAQNTTNTTAPQHAAARGFPTGMTKRLDTPAGQPASRPPQPGRTDQRGHTER